METRNDNHFYEANAAFSPESRFWHYAHTGGIEETDFCANGSACGVGSCGDRIHVDLQIEAEAIAHICCRPDGCIYTQACARALSALACGRTIEQALGIQPEDVSRELDGLPDDHMHCARLAVNTMGEAIDTYYRSDSTRRRRGADESAV